MDSQAGGDKARLRRSAGVEQKKPAAIAQATTGSSQDDFQPQVVDVTDSEPQLTASRSS